MMCRFARFFLSLGCLAGGVIPAFLSAGDIVGRIYADMGPDGPGGEAGGKYASRRFRFLETVDYEHLTDFVVHVDDIVQAAAAAPRAHIAQRDGAFEPHVLPIVAGTEVSFPNEDPIFHNVFSMSESTAFDLGYYKSSDDPKSVLFARQGRVDIFCSIHADMNCIVLVLPNPWFGVAGKDGRFAIRDVPAGTYQLRGWHERLPARRIEVVVPEEGEVEVDLALGLQHLPQL